MPISVWEQFMQIPSVPPPIVTNTLPQDVVNKAVPNLQALAPLTPDPVTASPKSEKSNQSRSNGERRKNGDRGEGGKGKRGGSVNIRV